MAKLGHEDPDESAEALLNPANWRPVVWGWILLFMVGGTGMFLILYQPAAAPQPAPSDDRQVRRSGPPGRPGASGEDAAGREYEAHPEAYRDQGREGGGGQGSSYGGGNQARASSGDWDRSGQDGKTQERAQFPKIFKGKHQNRTTSFTSPGSINIEWTTTGPLFQLFVKKSSGGSAGAPVTRSGLSGTSSGKTTVNVEGEIYFKVNSLGNWEVRVNSS